jgi:nucleoside-diphosphate-sugar epimerase
MNLNSPILVAGAGGFIGGWLVKDLQSRGFTDIRGADKKPLQEWYQIHADVENQVLDLSLLENCQEATRGRKIIYNLAADMGGMGFIENNKALCMLSVLINTHLLTCAIVEKVDLFFFASSACVYNQSMQQNTENGGLREVDAYPADPEDGYGWEKLFSERMCRHFMEDFGLNVRIARFHNVYGPFGTWDGGREKAPAAICRKIAQAKINGQTSIEIWGDGNQTRSFTHISDTLFGINALMESDYHEPINIGSDRLISVNGLVDIVETISGIKIDRTYNLLAPKGVRGRNSDNSLITEKLSWAPDHDLMKGLKSTYDWIYTQILAGKESL